jgi:hypothetical protein
MAIQVLVKYRAHKNSNELEPSKNVVIKDANTGQPVVWEPIECEVPAWFVATAERIVLNLLQFNNLVQQCQTNNHKLCTTFPVLTKQYEELLDNQ